MTIPHSASRAELRESRTGRRRPAHARPSRSHHVVRALALVMVGALAFVATGAGAVYYTLQNNIDSVDAASLLDAADRPAPPTPDPTDPDAGVPINLLLMGSDDRSGENGVIGGTEDKGMRSDTTIVLHISADRQRIDIVSIPRDSLVNIPECNTTNGTVRARKNAMFNSAFAYGWDKGQDIASAAACTMHTVETLTDVPISGFMVVDFAGFQTMIDAIGPIPMCIPERTISKEADLYLEAGMQNLNGQQALGLARARKGEGANMNGSDLSRIGRQQELLAATARTVLDKNVLMDSPALFQFLNGATSSLTTSREYADITTLAGLGFSLRSIARDNITFMTIPVAEAPSDRNRVVWTSEADEVWENMRADRPLVTPDVVETPTAPTPPDGEPTPPVEAAPDEPTPVETKKAGQEAFTSADTTAICPT